MHAHDLIVKTLGPCRIDSPVPGQLGRGGSDELALGEMDRILFDNRVSPSELDEVLPDTVPTFEPAMPRGKIYFDPSKTRVGIVTCGGLCPGINDVIRGLVMTLHYRYGVHHIHGFRYGFEGFVARFGHEVWDLTPDRVSNIHELGGTILASSRGKQDPADVVDCLQRMSINILFVIGGDGSQRGALAIAGEVERRGLKIAIVGVPKTIDNDIQFVDPSFGFQTAYSEACEAIRGAHVEAKGAPNGVGLVKLMGRSAGFIAAYASIASSEVNITLIPEVPFELEPLLHYLRERLSTRHHAVIVVAEGAGQELFDKHTAEHDASGNVRYEDIGLLLRDRITQDFKQRHEPINVKYIDPSYMIRSVRARPQDSVYCQRLAQGAVHAAMAGRTEMVVGFWHGHFVLVPMPMVCSGQRRIDPTGDLWLSVLQSTGQPPRFTAAPLP